jgi:hypothetical protein
MSDGRTATNRMIRLMDDGVLTPEWVAVTCLGYMSEDDVADMMRQNDLSDLLDEDTEYESE